MILLNRCICLESELQMHSKHRSGIYQTKGSFLSKSALNCAAEEEAANFERINQFLLIYEFFLADSFDKASPNFKPNRLGQL